MSQRHPTSRRTAQKQPENPDDLFVAKVLQVSNWANQHRQALIGIGVAVAVIVAGGLYWRTYQQSLLQQATQEFVTIQQTLALGGAEQAKADLQLFLQRFGGTRSAEEARLLLGQLELETGSPENAIAILEELAGNRTPLGMQATFLLAAAYEESGNVAEAERMYLAVANRSDMSFLVRDALAQAARIRMEGENYTGAAALYEEVLTYFEESDPGRQVFVMRLAEAQALREG